MKDKDDKIMQIQKKVRFQEEDNYKIEHIDLWINTQLTKQIRQFYSELKNETMQKMACSCLMISLIKRIWIINYNVIQWY